MRFDLNTTAKQTNRQGFQLQDSPGIYRYAEGENAILIVGENRQAVVIRGNGVVVVYPRMDVTSDRSGWMTVRWTPVDSVNIRVTELDSVNIRVME